MVRSGAGPKEARWGRGSKVGVTAGGRVGGTGVRLGRTGLGGIEVTNTHAG